MYIEDMLRSMPFLNVIATGNIKIESVSNYLKAGAVAVGIGRDLYDNQDAAGIEEKARELISQVEKFKSEIQN